jgi:hypothetical protein
MTVRVGVIGHHESLLQTALVKAGELGHVAIGTLEVAAALDWVEAKSVDALVIGGGVEPVTRRLLLAACRRSGVPGYEVFGPGNLQSTLRSI